MAVSGWQLLCLSLTAAGVHHPLPAVLQPRPHLQEVPGEALPGLWGSSCLSLARGGCDKLGPGCPMPRGSQGVPCDPKGLPSHYSNLLCLAGAGSSAWCPLLDGRAEITSSSLPLPHTILTFPFFLCSKPASSVTLRCLGQCGWARLYCGEA